MKLEEAIKSIENDIEVSCWATDIVIEELRRLQKENKELTVKKISLELTDKWVERNMIHKQKITKKIEELEEKIKFENDDRVIVWLYKQKRALEDLLKEE